MTRLQLSENQLQCARRGKVGTVGNVENVALESETNALADGKVAVNVEVKLLEMKPAQGVAAGRARAADGSYYRIGRAPSGRSLSRGPSGASTGALFNP